MTAKQLESYILSKQDVRKRVIPEWRSIRYTVYSSAIATIFEYNGEPALTVYGRYGNYEKEYGGAVTPAVDNEPKRFTTVFFTRGVPAEAVKQMIDCSYVARLKQMARPRIAVKGAERVPYCGIVSGYYVENGVIKARKSTAPDEVFAAVDDEIHLPPDKAEHPNLEGTGSMNNVPYSATVTSEQLSAFLDTRKDLCDDLQHLIDASANEDCDS